jgi:hypothetical protein
MKTVLVRRVYRVMLLAYPRDFRREYGAQMLQLLRDCERDAQTPLALLGVWARTFFDLVCTAPAEHIHNLRKENRFMNKRSEVIAMGFCTLLIACAFVLLSYGRSHEIPAILRFGFVLDALVFTGVVGNLIVFGLMKLTSMRPMKIALWTFLLVCAVPALAIVGLAGRDPKFQAFSVVIGYAVSFFFWFGLHWLWEQKLRPTQTA